MKNKSGLAILTAIALIIKLLRIGGFSVCQIYAVQGVCANEIWFVLGMILSFVGSDKIRRVVAGSILGTVFIVLTLWTFKFENGWIAFIMGILACSAVFMLFSECEENKLLSWFAKYTMPIFLMHTLFAAPIRVVLLKIGINNSEFHVLLGIIISFVGPIVTMWILEKIKLYWIVYPGKLMKRKGGNWLLQNNM